MVLFVMLFERVLFCYGGLCKVTCFLLLISSFVIKGSTEGTIHFHPILHVKEVRKDFLSYVYVVITYLLSEPILENNITVFPTFQSVDEILRSDHSNENRTMWY